MELSSIFELPVELRNRVRRFAVDGVASAGAVALLDDTARRRKILLVVDRDQDERDQLLSPQHYLRRALAPSAELTEEGILDGMLTSPDVVVLADVAELTEAETQKLVDWVDGGGIVAAVCWTKNSRKQCRAK